MAAKREGWREGREGGRGNEGMEGWRDEESENDLAE